MPSNQTVTAIISDAKAVKVGDCLSSDLVSTINKNRVKSSRSDSHFVSEFYIFRCFVFFYSGSWPSYLMDLLSLWYNYQVGHHFVGFGLLC